MAAYRVEVSGGADRGSSSRLDGDGSNAGRMGPGTTGGG